MCYNIIILADTYNVVHKFGLDSEREIRTLALPFEETAPDLLILASPRVSVKPVCEVLPDCILIMRCGHLCPHQHCHHR